MSCPHLQPSDFNSVDEALGWVKAKVKPFEDLSRPPIVHPDNYKLSENFSMFTMAA